VNLHAGKKRGKSKRNGKRGTQFFCEQFLYYWLSEVVALLISLIIVLFQSILVLAL
jgi:hypothetical protein